MSQKYYLSICACVHNETRYLKEWILFHKKQGVERFYLYDNNSTDNLAGFLRSNGLLEYVTLISWRVNPAQKLAYNNYLSKYKDESFWTAFIDIDEYLFCPGKLLSINLRGYEGCAALAVHWYLYGSSGLKEYVPEPVIRRFQRRAATVNPHVKTILQNKYGTKVGHNVHTFRVEGDIWDENRIVQPREYAWIKTGTANIFRINHYHTKSYAEAAERWARPRADTGQMRDFDTSFPAHDCNEVFDDSAIKAMA